MDGEVAGADVGCDVAAGSVFAGVVRGAVGTAGVGGGGGVVGGGVVGGGAIVGVVVAAAPSDPPLRITAIGSTVADTAVTGAAVCSTPSLLPAHAPTAKTTTSMVPTSRGLRITR